jgi:hypothetical protein
MKKFCGVTLLLIALNLHASEGCHSKDQMVGTWKLLSATSRSLTGTVNHAAFGSHPSGFLTLTLGGRLSFIAADDNRRQLSVLDRVTAPAAERAQAFATIVAYAGTYSLSCDKVIYHVEVSTIQNWVGSDLTRSIHLNGRHLSLTTPVTRKGGASERIQLVFDKIE